MSEGGPLICVEAALAETWGGIDRLSVSKPGAETDYDRAYEGLRKALTTAPLKNGAALFFQGPYDTSFWRRPSDDKVFVVRIEACEIDTDFDALLRNIDDKLFEDPIETTDFTFLTGDLKLFDSAWNGDDRELKFIKFTIETGKYFISTKYIETNEYSIYLHRFDK